MRIDSELHAADSSAAAAAVEALDIGIFRIPSQTSVDDKKTLLAIQRAVRDFTPSYIYLECGSHLGGSLLPHLLDPRCTAVYSVDARPERQADERGVEFSYDRNSTRRMMQLLSEHASADQLRKLTCIDTAAAEVSRSGIRHSAHLVMIDAEHTNRAVFEDFLALHRFAAPAAVFIFHDADLIFSGLMNIETYLRYSDVEFTSAFYPSSIFGIYFGAARERAARLSAMAIDRGAFETRAHQNLIRAHYRAYRAERWKRAIDRTVGRLVRPVHRRMRP